MKKRYFNPGIILLLFIALIFSACEKNTFTEKNTGIQGNLIGSIDPFSKNNGTSIVNPDEICGKIVNVGFIAVQNIQVGIVMLWNTPDHFYVTYLTDNNWVIAQTHLYAGPYSDIPLNRNGNPATNLFPIIDSFSPFVNSCTYEFDKTVFDECFVIVAQANVNLLDDRGNIIRSESAWSAGNVFHSPVWATYTDYCLQECPGCVYETVSTPIFAGKTIPVGHLDVTNDDEFLTVSYILENDWYLDETHLYVGTLENLPINNGNNPVIGHFPFKEDQGPEVNIYTCQIPLENLPECYIIAAHADVYKMINNQIIQQEGAWAFGTKFPGANRWGWYYDYCTQICN